MTERQAKTALRQMLRTFTLGSILALLGDVIAGRLTPSCRDAKLSERRRTVQSTLFVVGLGFDAACPR